MSGFPPEMESMLTEFLRPYEEQISNLQQEKQELRERLRVYESGTHMNQNDIDRLERRLRDEQDQNAQLTRRVRELETGAQTTTVRIQQLEAQLQRANQDMTSDVRDKKAKEDRIDELQKKINQMENAQKKQRDETIEFLSMKRQLTDQNASLTRQNDQLNQAIESLLQREEEINKVLNERGQYIAEIEGNVQTLQKKVQKYEREIHRLRKNQGSVAALEQTDILPQEDDATMTLQGDVLKLREENHALKERVIKLEEEELRAMRLQKALEKRNTVIEGFRKELQEKDEQIIQYNITKNEIIQQLDTYRKRVEEQSKENVTELVEARKTAEYLEERYQATKKRLQDVEAMLNRNKTELDKTRQQIEGVKNGTYGLSEAMNEMKELRAMIEVRDSHIAELVSQVNSMDKIMMGLSKQLDPNFDLEQFLEKMNKVGIDEERLRTEKAARELEAKIELLKQRGPAGDIQIVVGKDSRPLKTIIYEDGTPGTITSHASQAYRRRRREQDHDSGNDSIVVPKGKQHILGKKKFKKDDSRVSSKKVEVKHHKIDDEQNESDLEVTGNGNQLDNDNESSHSEKPADQERTKEGEINFMSMVPMQPMGGPERDEWVVDLQKKFVECQKERDSLQNQLKELRIEYDVMKNDITRLNSQKQEYSVQQTPIIPHKSEEPAQTPPQEQKPAPQIVQIPVYDRSNLTTRSVQTKAPKPAKLELMQRSSVFEKSKAPPLTLVSNSENAVVSPSPEELQVFDARQNALRTELESVTRDLAEKDLAIGDSARKLEQRDQMLSKLRETIADLEKQLIDQREVYQQKLGDLRKESYQYADKKVKEAMEVRDVASRFGQTAPAAADLAEVSNRISQLNRDKERLEDVIREEKANANLAQRQASQYKAKLKEAEAELESLREQLEKNGSQNRMKEYNAEMNLKYRALERKCAELKKENSELKHSRPGRNDPQGDAREQHAIDDDSEEGARETRRMRSAEAKLMTLKVQNEEMQLRLGKANGTIERLNQLLQRKEAQLMKLKEQASQFKHQIVSKQKEVTALRTKQSVH